MGFYGNITNTAKTQFQFDRIFSNRYEMDGEDRVNADGVYIGRYVLVEYDTETHFDTFLQVQKKDGVLYYNPTGGVDKRTELFQSQVKLNQIVYDKANKVFYKIIAPHDETSPSSVNFAEVVKDAEDTPNYTKNYNIDIQHYGEGRGYDSTVWMKTYVSGDEKYVMIAELNSVVPTFDIAADAPTMVPIVPHFDTNSTDLYYKLHWQAPWGMRVAENSSYSDETASQEVVRYNPLTGTQTSETKNYSGAIYYNKAGFDKINRVYSNLGNKISILPTGYSGNLYNKHDGTSDVEEKPDIQEVSIMLPALGNAICDIWDIIYGQNRQLDISWKEPGESSTNATRDLNTLAGCINRAHDIIGMIVSTTNSIPLNKAEYQKHLIYRQNDKYYRICKKPAYVWIDITVPDRKDFTSDQEYNAALEAIGLSGDLNYYVLNGTTYERISRFAIQPGQKIYKENSWTYEKVEIVDFGNNLGTLLGTLVDLKNLLEGGGPSNRSLDNVAGALNSLNDIINNFTDLVPGEFLICDDKGKVNSANWTTAQNAEWTNYGNSKTGSFGAKENQWIALSLDKVNKLIQVAHTTHTVADTTTSSNVNGNGDNIKLYTPIVDNMGHIVGRNTETITLPYGYKTIKASNSTTVSAPAETIKTAGQIAANTQDTLIFAASNKWIKIDNNTVNTLKLGHINSSFATGTVANTTYGLTGDVNEETKTFNAPELTFDEAGHITKAATHTITLPDNFKTISVKVNDTTANKSTAGSAGNFSANSLTDTLTLNEGNRWINLTTNAANRSLTISHYANDISTSTQKANYTDKTFTVQKDNWDKAGHITSSNSYTYTMPDGIKTVAIANDGANSIILDTAAASGNLAAAALEDTISFTTGNRWMRLVADVNNKKVSIYHTAPGTQSGTSQTGAETPNFGKSFKIPEIKYDAAGHITGTATHDITLPKPSLAVSEVVNAPANSTVITTLGLNGDTGAMTATLFNAGYLVLSGYTGQRTGDIVDGDTINSALGKLQNKIKDLQDQVSTQQNTITGLQGQVSTLQNTIASLTTRIEALEKAAE